MTQAQGFVAAHLHELDPVVHLGCWRRLRDALAEAALRARSRSRGAQHGGRLCSRGGESKVHWRRSGSLIGDLIHTRQAGEELGPVHVANWAAEIRPRHARGTAYMIWKAGGTKMKAFHMSYGTRCRLTAGMSDAGHAARPRAALRSAALKGEIACAGWHTRPEKGRVRKYTRPGVMYQERKRRLQPPVEDALKCALTGSDERLTGSAASPAPLQPKATWSRRPP